MRLIPVLLALAPLLAPLPALGWSFSPVPVCTLRHGEAGVAVTVTYDPALPEYAIELTLDAGVWPDSPAFHIAFQGGRALTIGTGFHVLSDDGRSLTVRDRGFENVLDGLEFNLTARAFAGDLSVTFGLDGAPEPVRQFRACPQNLNLS